MLPLMVDDATTVRKCVPIMHDKPTPLQKTFVNIAGPKKLKIDEVYFDEPFSLVLKKVKPPAKKKGEVTTSQLPKFLLKSRIKKIAYPPEESRINVTELILAVKDCGVLSRNYKEAEDVLKKKPKKKKLPLKPEKDLDEFQPEELLPKVKDVTTIMPFVKKQEKVEKPEDMPEDARKLSIGKGKIPKEEDVTDDVILKKIPTKPVASKSGEILDNTSTYEINISNTQPQLINSILRDFRHDEHATSHIHPTNTVFDDQYVTSSQTTVEPLKPLGQESTYTHTEPIKIQPLTQELPLISSRSTLEQEYATSRTKPILDTEESLSYKPLQDQVPVTDVMNENNDIYDNTIMFAGILQKEKVLPEKAVVEFEESQPLDIEEKLTQLPSESIEEVRPLDTVDIREVETYSLEDEGEKVDSITPKSKKKIQPMTLDRKKLSTEAQKVTESAPESPMFAQMKLKKSSPKIKEKEEKKTHKVLLKSRITRISYPPEITRAIITEFSVVMDNGILSRNYEEAQKVKKKKLKKPKLPESEEIQLEQYEKIEETIPVKTVDKEEKPLKEQERVIEKSDELETRTLETGKSEIIQPDVQEEKVQLKKVPEKLKKSDDKKKEPEQKLESVKPITVEEESTKSDDVIAEKKKPKRLMPIEKVIKDVDKPQKPKIEKLENEPFSIKLKKAKPVEKKQEKPQAPTFLLKSKLTRIDYPPKEQKGEIKNISAPIKDNGILSRNYEEAKTIPRKKSKKIKIPKDKEEDEIKEDLPVEEKIDEIEKPDEEKPETKLMPTKYEKLTPLQKTEVKVAEPKKPKVEEVKCDEPFSLVLKKVKPSAKKKGEVTTSQLPKFLLKSRIKKINYPPEESHIKVTELVPAVKDCGVLSRNYKEAEEVLKKKPKKKKLPLKPETDLEEFQPEELLPKEKEETTIMPVVKKPEKVEKPEDMPEEARKLSIGKGKIPKEEDVTEDVKLKKIPTKPVEKDEEKPKEKKPKVEEDKPSKIPKEYPDLEVKFVPDVDFPDRDISESPIVETSEESPKVVEKDKPKGKPKEKKKKQEEEPSKRELILGTPKEKSPDEEVEVKFRIPTKDRPEDAPEKLQLKPFEKVQPKEEREPEDTDFEGKIKPKEIPDVEEPTDAKVGKKLKKKKPDKQHEKSPETKPVDKVVPELEEECLPAAKTKLIPQKIEKKEIKPQQMKVESITPDKPLFSTIKLRKSSVTPKVEQKPAEMKKFLLKSRVTRVEYPPVEKKLVITILPKVEKDCGILSRNYQEALKVKKTKPKKIKLSDVETTELETYEPTPFDKESVSPEEDKTLRPLPEKPKYLKEEEVTIPLKMGKGEKPIEEDQPEIIKLKKIPQKEEVEEKKPEKPTKKTDVEDEQKVKIPKEEIDQPFEPIKPFETQDSKVELEEIEKLPKFEKEKIVDEKKPKKKVKPVKEEEIPETIPLKLGKPKPKPEDETKEIVLKKPQQKELEDEPTEIVKLKPFKETPDQTDDSSDQKVTLSIKPVKEVEKEEAEPEKVVIRKTKPKKKPLSEDESKEEITLSIKIPSEEVTEESQEVVIKKKPKKPTIRDEMEEDATIIIQKVQPKEITEKETTEEITIKKKKPKEEQPTEETTESVTLTVAKPQEKEEVIATEEVTVKSVRRKSKPKIVETAEDKVEISLKVPKEAPVQEEVVVEEVLIKKKGEKPKEVPEEKVTLELKKPVEKEEVIDATEEVTVKSVRKKSKPKIVESAEEKAGITIKLPQKAPVEEEVVVVEEVVIKKKGEKPKEVPEEKVTLELKKPVEKEEVIDATEEVTVKSVRKKSKPKIVESAEEKAGITIKLPQEAPVEEEVVTEEIVIKKKGEKPQEVPEEKVTLELKKPKEIEQVSEQHVTLKKKKKPLITEEQEEISETITLTKEKPKPVETSETVTEEVSIKKKMKPKKPLEETTEAVSLTIEKEIEVPKETEEEEEPTAVIFRPKKKVSIKEEEESFGEVTIKKPKKPAPKEETEYVENVTFKPKIKKLKEEVEQEFNIKCSSYEEEEIEMSGKVKLPRKKKPSVVTEEADSETVYITEEIDEGPDNVKFPLRRKSSTTTPYTVEEVEEVQLGLRKPRTTSIISEEESLDIKLKRKPSKPTIQSFQQEEASLEITREVEITEEGQVEGNILYSICTYLAETKDALNLVEGEKVYVLENKNAEWWFVKKHLTEEKGWVPAVYLRDEVSYNQYVQKKLHEKIDKLPIFERPGPGSEVFAPKFIGKLQPKRVQDGGTVQFECKVEGNPRPQITWFRQTAIIKPSQDFQIFYDEDNVATLIINEVFPEDAGMFTCVAKNSAGFTSSTTELIVETPLSEHGSDVTGHSRMSLSRESSLADIVEGIPPTFAKRPKARVVAEGSTVVFEVRLAAVPEPDITWSVAGRPLKPSSTVKITSGSDMHMYVSKLEIENVKKDQQGIYTVTAKNREGEASLDITLKVVNKEGEAPIVIEPLKDTVISEGAAENRLTCVVSGQPTPTVQWLRDGKPVKGGQTLPDGLHSLDLPSTQSKGTYTVKATNKHGTAETTSTVTVQGAPHPQAPMFVKRFEEQKIREKGTIRLVAQVVGNPIPTVTWFRNNKTLLASPRITEMYDGEQIVLEITDADSEEDAGDYKCVATNSVGSTTHGARITIDVEKVSFTKLLAGKMEVDETDMIKLVCETSHTVSTTWLHEGKELSGMDHREIVQEGRQQSLVIKRAHLSDIGQYTCRVKDQLTSTQLTVHGVKAAFVRKLEDFEVQEQEVAILEVELSSETAQVTWQKDGMDVEPVPGKIEMETAGTVRKLLIRSTSVHDEGEYTCVLGDQECSADVSVIELPPEILTKMQDVTVPRGEKAMFEVELTKGDALVRWFKNDKELQFSEHVQLSIDGKKQKLKIYNSENSDAGSYSCRVGDQVSTAKLTVEEPQVEFITRLPDVTMLPIDTDAEFTVELSRSDVNVKWLKKGKEIKASSKYIIQSDGAKRKLIIKKISLEDQSDYTCLALNIKTSTKLKVEVIETAPKIIEGPTEFRVKKGEDITLDVRFKATPTPTAEWTVNGKVVKPSKKIEIKVEEGSASLTIKKVQVEDVGSYTVKLRNNVGEASAELTLIIIELPGAPGKPDIIETSNTSVTIHWKEPLSDGNSPILSYIVEHHDKDEFMVWHEISDVKETTHRVTGLQTDHEVMFRVRAVNIVGKSEASDNTRYVVVTEPKEEEAPTIQEQLRDTSVGLGREVVLTCVVSGVPTPEVKWFKDGKPLKVKTVTFENRVAKLSIAKTVETSGGKYSCRATNKVGSDETSCTLTIQESPTLKIDTESCVDRMQISNQWKPRVFYNGYPRPDITWTKDGGSIETSKRVSMFTEDATTTLAIYSVERIDSGVYTVTAKNQSGSASVDINFRVIDKPSKPEAIGVKEIEVDTVTVEWKPPADDGGIDITKYSLEKCQVGKSIWTKVADIERDARSYIVQRLQTNAEYMFRVSAQNVVGTSEFVESESVTITSKLNKPSAPSAPLEVSDMTETSCTLKWYLPLSDGGSPIIEYVIEKKLYNETTWSQVGSTSELTITVKDLEKQSSYDFRISARNKIGTGPALTNDEPIIVGKRRNPPSAPLNLMVTKIASKSVSLQWNPPKDNGGSDVTGYVIEKQAVDKSSWTKVVTLDSHLTSFTVENLKEKSELYFRVAAENAVGLGPPAVTSLVSLRTHATVPSPPTAPLEVRSTGATSVVVEWGVPESDGGAPIEGYKIAVRDMKKTMWMEVGQVAADVQRLAIRELQENHEYMIRIFARNEVGLSDPLESDEPFKVQRPDAGVEEDIEEYGVDKETPSLSFTTTTTQSWLREAGMDPDIYSYSRHTLLRRSEYFFRIWYYAKHLFK